MKVNGVEQHNMILQHARHNAIGTGTSFSFPKGRNPVNNLLTLMVTALSYLVDLFCFIPLQIR